MPEPRLEATIGPAPAREDAVRRRSQRTVWLTGVLALLLIGGAGCGPVGWMAHGIGGGGQRVIMPADYAGLQARSVAVLVAVDDRTLHQYRQAPAHVSRAVGMEIAEHVEGAQLTSSRKVLAFQEENPYWATDRYSRLARELNVDRLVIIDVMDYRTHEPGNRHVWQGTISGTVLVVDVDDADPDNPVYSATVQADYPEDTKLGTLQADDATIQANMVKIFATKVGQLFYDHEVLQ